MAGVVLMQPSPGYPGKSKQQLPTWYASLETSLLSHKLNLYRTGLSVFPPLCRIKLQIPFKISVQAENFSKTSEVGWFLFFSKQPEWISYIVNKWEKEYAYISKSGSAMTERQNWFTVLCPPPFLQFWLIRNLWSTLYHQLHAWKQSTKSHVQFSTYKELRLLLEDQSGDNAWKHCKFFGCLWSLGKCRLNKLFLVLKA